MTKFRMTMSRVVHNKSIKVLSRKKEAEDCLELEGMVLVVKRS